MGNEIRKRSVYINSRKTSISLEDRFWECLREISDEQGMSISAFITRLDSDKPQNLSSAIRLAVLDYYITKCENLIQDEYLVHSAFAARDTP